MLSGTGLILTTSRSVGLSIRDKEDVIVEGGEMPPDDEICVRCGELYNEEVRRRLGQAYALLLELAARKRNRPADDIG